jgi:ketosteroid isomerase-like protein
MSRESQDAIAALRVNAAFYAAIADGDLQAMDRIWARDEPVLCIHPGGPPLQGRIDVMASWAEVFRGGAPPISFGNDSVSLIRGLAFVNCVEHLGDTVLSASNILVWEDGAWRIVQHTAGVLSAATSAADIEPSGPLH